MGLPPPDFESGASASSATPGTSRKDTPNRKKPQTPADNPDLESTSDPDSIRSLRNETHGNDLNRSEFRQGSGKAQGPFPPDLAHLVDTWPHLPEHIRAAVLALVDTNAKRGDT